MKSSQSSGASFSQISTAGFSGKPQHGSQNSQNSQSPFQQKVNSQQTQPVYSQISSVQSRNSYQQQDERGSNQFNNSFRINQQSSSNQTQSLSQFLQDDQQESHMESQNDIKDSFYIQNPIITNSPSQFQYHNGVIIPQSSLNQSQLFLPTIQESKVTCFDGRQSQLYIPQETRAIIPNLNQSSIILGQYHQQSQLSGAQFQMIQDELQRQKIEQKERELQLKQELLSEMKELKSYFKTTIIEQLQTQNEKSSQQQESCKQHFSQVQKKVEQVVKTVFDFLSDDTNDKKKKTKVSGSEYAQNISDLYTTVNQIKRQMDLTPKSFSDSVTQDINKALQILFAKITTAKNSVKKQIIQSTARPMQKRGPYKKNKNNN